MALSFQFVLALIFYLCPCFEVKESRACCGSYGSQCTSHNLGCSSGLVVIQEAFFTDSTACGPSGVSDCANVSLNSISLIGTRHNLSDTDLDSIYSDCCLQSYCSLRAPWGGGGSLTFSAIVYQCRNGTLEECFSTHTTTSQNTRELPSTDITTGAIAGSLIGVLVVCAVVAAVIIWFKFVRKKKKDERPEKGSDNNELASSLSNTAIEYGGSRKTTSNYDYATIHKEDNPVGRVQNHYILGKPRTENGTTVFMEDDHNHINHNPPQGASSRGYDTTASAAAEVKKLKNASNCTDDDDYNHLGDGKPSVVSSDYDTTVPVSKAVAHLGEMKDSEDDYDHFKRSEDRVIDSPYDTANHQSCALADTTPSPYDLAK